MLQWGTLYIICPNHLASSLKEWVVKRYPSRYADCHIADEVTTLAISTVAPDVTDCAVMDDQCLLYPDGSVTWEWQADVQP